MQKKINLSFFRPFIEAKLKMGKKKSKVIFLPTHNLPTGSNHERRRKIVIIYFWRELSFRAFSFATLSIFLEIAYDQSDQLIGHFSRG